MRYLKEALEEISPNTIITASILLEAIDRSYEIEEVLEQAVEDCVN